MGKAMRRNPRFLCLACYSPKIAQPGATDNEKDEARTADVEAPEESAQSPGLVRPISAPPTEIEN